MEREGGKRRRTQTRADELGFWLAGGLAGLLRALGSEVRTDAD